MSWKSSRLLEALASGVALEWLILGPNSQPKNSPFFLNQMWVGEIFFSSDPECLKVLRY